MNLSINLFSIAIILLVQSVFAGYSNYEDQVYYDAPYLPYGANVVEDEPVAIVEPEVAAVRYVLPQVKSRRYVNQAPQIVTVETPRPRVWDMLARARAARASKGLAGAQPFCPKCSGNKLKNGKCPCLFKDRLRKSKFPNIYQNQPLIRQPRESKLRQVVLMNRFKNLLDKLSDTVNPPIHL